MNEQNEQNEQKKLPKWKDEQNELQLELLL